MRTNNILLRAVSLTLGFILSATALLAQNNIQVTGTVTDVNKEPIVGASVLQKGTTNGTMTDLDGNFTLSVPEGSMIEVSTIGFVTQTLKAAATLNVILAEDSELLEETVVVGYGVQKRESLTGAIAQIRSEDIASTKNIDGVTALQGKIPGLMINQNTGKPGAFDNTINVRGFGTPIIVVDGVVRSSTKTRKSTGWNNDPTALESYTDMSILNELNPEDIESVSVLKDASATIYGLGAANGVILITTKKGQVRKPGVNFSTMLSLTSPIVPRDVESWTSFMKWENAMSDVSKMAHRFSDEVIAAYENGDPNYIYTDWYGETYKKFAFNQQYNVSVNGGTEAVNYYFSANYANDNPIIRADNYGYDRYSFNGNINVKLTETLSARYNTTFRQSKTLSPGNMDMDWNLLYYIYQSNPMVGVHPKNNPGHYSDVEEHCNPLAIIDRELAGYAQSDNKSFNNNLDLTYTAPFLKGLTLTAMGAYDFDRNKVRTLVKMYNLYDYETDAYVPGATTRAETQYSEYWGDNTRLYGRFQALYDNRFGNHNVSAMLGGELTDYLTAYVNADRFYGATADEFLFTHDTLNQGLKTRSNNAGTRSNTRSAGYIGRINYNYSGKYLLEVMGRYDGNYQFARGHRWGFFPSYSLGWRVSEEKFFKDALPFVNNLKVRWSDGNTGSIQGSPYAYIGGYTQNGSWIFTEGSTTNGFANNTVENTILTWAKVRMMDFGVDWELWQGKFGGTFDWYKRVIDGIAATRTASLPDFYAVTLPQENLNKSETQGLELSVYHRNQIGAFNYRVQANVTFARSRDTYLESEATRNYTSSMDYWKKSTVNRWKGYFGGSYYDWAGGQFTSLADAAHSQVLYDSSTTGSGNRSIVPGQYYIVDRNGNGYIDTMDVFYTWGSSNNPPLQYGLLFNGNWKNLDFSLVFNGSALRHKTYMAGGYASFGKLNYLPSQYTDSYHVTHYGDDPWDPKTEWTPGYWPALARTAQSGSFPAVNGMYMANQPYKYVNAAYLRLKTLEIGYRLSPKLLKEAGIKSARVFFNGGNLLTICNPLLKYVDPESSDSSGSAGGYYQLSKTFNFGFNLNF